METSLLCGSLVVSGMALIVGVLSLACSLSCRRRLPATARHVARATSRREILGYWASVDRQFRELNDRVDAIPATARRPVISIARTAPTPRVEDAA